MIEINSAKVPIDLVRAGVDLVSGLEAADRADRTTTPARSLPKITGRDTAGWFDLAVPDFGVQRIDARGVDLNQHVVIPQLRVRHLDGGTLSLLPYRSIVNAFMMVPVRVVESGALQELQNPGHERVVVLERAAVAGVGVDLQFAVR